jgi:hypothetical protein
MKNFIVALMVVFGMSSLSFGGDCANGVCSLPRKTVSVTKNIVRETVVLPRRVVSGCVNSCRCKTRTRTSCR